MRKLYGSFTNRMMENKVFGDEIKVGEYATEYLYTDRHAYEVVEVEDQKHVTIREVKAIRTDNYGMSEDQEYRYESVPNGYRMKLAYRNGGWYKVSTFTKKGMMKNAEQWLDTFNGKLENAYNYIKYMSGLTEKQLEKIEQGGEVKRYSKISISFGIADEHFDYSF